MDQQLSDKRLISIVVPVYNEKESLEALLGEIRTVAKSQQWRVEIIFVDDGSSDGSWEAIKTLAQANTPVGGIRFRVNAGKAAALMAGFAAAQGDVVFMMDADLQDPPEEMPRLLEQLDAGVKAGETGGEAGKVGGADMVSGWKKIRHDPWHKVYPSRAFNWLIGALTGVELHDHVCGFKCFRRPVVSDLKLYGEFHRFIGVLAASNGYRVTEIPTTHRPRTTGISKYGFARFAKGFLDLLTVVTLTRFRWRPQHLIGVAGLWLSAIWGLLLVIHRCTPGFLSVISPVGLLLSLLSVLTPGVMLVAIGLVAQLIVDQRPAHEQYIIAERVGWCATTTTLATTADKVESQNKP